MDDLIQFRKDKDTLFATGTESPLTDEQKANFAGLKYYPFNPDLIFRNLNLEKEEGTIIQIKTSAGDYEPYKKIGKIHFEVNNIPCQLTVFQSDLHGQLFLPFKDKTNDSETYHDGRYIEIEIENDQIPELDFNYAYNPYCAYNSGWRCPITPEENILPVAIEAGEKRFH